VLIWVVWALSCGKEVKVVNWLWVVVFKGFLSLVGEV
jgi:hypothetical protein